MKIIEVNSDNGQDESQHRSNEHEDSDSNNTQMSLGEVDAELEG